MMIGDDHSGQQQKAMMGGTSVVVAPRRLGLFTWCCVLLSTVSAMLMGYDIGIMSGAILFIRDDLHLSLLQEEVTVGSLNLFAAFGSLCAGFVANRLGRRRALLVASALFFLGAALLAASLSFAWLLAGRLLTGLGVGFAMMIAPLYSAEISPASVRGFLVSFTEVFVNVGILLGYLIGFAFQFLSPSFNWRLMLGAGALPAILLAAGTIFVLPESPRWLVIVGHLDLARTVLKDVVCGGDAIEAEQRLAEIMEANEAEGGSTTSGCFSCACACACTTSHTGGSRRLSGVLSPLTRMYIVAIGINFFQQASGIDALVYYSPVVFKQAGVTTKMGMLGATVGMGVVKLGFVFVATYLLDRAGRKKLLYISAGGVIVCLTTVAATFVLLGLNSAEGDSLLSVADKKAAAGGHGAAAGVAVTIVAVFAYVAFFSVGFGPISYVLTSEIFPLKHRSAAVGLSVFVNRAVSGTVALTFLSIAKALTPAGTFGLFAGFTLLSLVFVALLVPETKGKTLEEISLLFGSDSGSGANDQTESANSVQLAHKL